MQSDPLIPGAIALPPNFVWRSYVGGRVLRQFRGARGSAHDDDHFPEDWLASTVRARNGPNSRGEDEGLSRTGDGVLLAKTLTEHPEFWWGGQKPNRSGTGVLWKLLDSAARLQLQAHPDAAFARRHLDSDAGKTECWYILATRGEAYVYLGFQKSPGTAEWGRMIRAQQVGRMLECFERIPVRSGDCLVVPAGTPHAIGPGIFMMELQEPTDWVVRCETSTTDGKPLPPQSCFMGLDLDRCLEVFDYESRTVDEVMRRWKQSPREANRGATHLEEEVIGGVHHHFFRLHRLRGSGTATWAGDELMMLVALRGSGVLAADGQERAIRTGETWLLPGCVPRWEWRTESSDWEFLLAKAPRARTIGADHHS